MSCDRGESTWEYSRGSTLAQVCDALLSCLSIIFLIDLSRMKLLINHAIMIPRSTDYTWVWSSDVYRASFVVTFRILGLEGRFVKTLLRSICDTGETRSSMLPLRCLVTPSILPCFPSIAQSTLPETSHHTRFGECRITIWDGRINKRLIGAALL